MDTNKSKKKKKKIRLTVRFLYVKYKFIEIQLTKGNVSVGIHSAIDVNTLHYNKCFQLSFMHISFSVFSFSAVRNRVIQLRINREPWETKTTGKNAIPQYGRV